MKKLFVIFYYILSFTWGFLMSFVGLLTAIVVLLLKGTPHKNGCSLIIEFGGNWGGLSLGCFSFCGRSFNKSWFEHTRRHEFGHSLQNCIFGPFFIFLVAIPSAIRFHWQKNQRKQGARFSPDWYDSVWFEGTATKYGTKFMRYF